MHVAERRNKTFVSRDASRSLYRVDSRLGMFGPWLNHDVGFTRGNDVTGRCTFLVGCETADVIFVTVSSDDGVQLPLTPFLDILRDAHHQFLLLRFLLRTFLGSRWFLRSPFFWLCGTA